MRAPLGRRSAARWPRSPDGDRPEADWGEQVTDDEYAAAPTADSSASVYPPVNAPDAADLTMAWRCRLQWAKGDLNPHPLAGTWPSTMRVCLFRHSPLLTPSTWRVCLFRHSDVVHLGAGGL
jgi:hypothetical protein